MESSLVGMADDGYYSKVTVKNSQASNETSFRDLILQVKETADIVQVIGQYVPLKKSGARYLGLCPFHHDRSPSMNVNPQMGIYKCFACGAGGDVLKFVQEYEKLDFVDALRAVASRAGVAFPEHLHFSKDDESKGKASEALAANQLACRFYQEELEASAETLEYVASRGISEETRKHFQLGLSPKSNEKLLKRAAAKNIPVQAFIDAGIMGEADGGRIYDRFSGRLIFPIWNMSGHVIGFGGRVLTPGQQPKYVNSPESAFYHKSKVLYGLNFSRNSIDKLSEAVIVEGYMDMLALWQAGVQNAVAVSGTALTKDHVQILARFARKTYLFFDGDGAGRKAVRRSLDPLVTMGLEVKVPVLPIEEDPDSYTRKNGGDKVRELFSASEDIVGFLMRSAEKPLEAMSPEEKNTLLQECLDLLQNMPSPLVREQYQEEIRKRLGLKSIPRPRRGNFGATDAFGSSAAQNTMEVSDTVAVFAGAMPGGRPKEEALAEWQLLQLLLSSNLACAWALDRVKLEWLQVETVKNLTDHLLAFYEENGKLEIKEFLNRLSQEDQDSVIGMRMIENMDEAEQKKHFSGILLALEIRSLRKQISSEPDITKRAITLKRLNDLQSFNRQAKVGPNE